MMKKMLWKICGFTLVPVVIVSFAQHLWLFVFITPAYKDLFSTKDIRPIHLKIKVEDQFAEVVPDYEFKVQLGYRHWYFWIFPHPSLAGGNKIVKLKTNKNGIAKLSYLFKKAYRMQILEDDDREKYAFGKIEGRVTDITGKIRTRAFYDESTLWSLLNPKSQEMILHVLRHDPSAKLASYEPELKVKKDGHLEGYEAKDENSFTLDIIRNKFFEGKSDGDVLLTIKYLRTVFEAYKKKSSVKGGNEGDYDPSAEWNLIIEGQGNVVIQQKDPEIATYAPSQGYKKRITYDLAHCYLFSTNAAEELNKVGWGSISNPEANLLPSKSTADEDEYKVVVGNQFRRDFYLKNIGKGYYGVLSINIDTDLVNGKIMVRPECRYNPDGTNNLWTGK